MKKLALLLAVLILTSVFGGCATFRGLGEDLQNLGKKLEDKASK